PGAAPMRSSYGMQPKRASPRARTRAGTHRSASADAALPPAYGRSSDAPPARQAICRQSRRRGGLPVSGGRVHGRKPVGSTRPFASAATRTVAERRARRFEVPASELGLGFEMTAFAPFVPGVDEHDAFALAARL